VQVAVPVVLDRVVGAPRKELRDGRPAVPILGMLFHYLLLLRLRQHKLAGSAAKTWWLVAPSEQARASQRSGTTAQVCGTHLLCAERLFLQSRVQLIEPPAPARGHRWSPSSSAMCMTINRLMRSYTRQCSIMHSAAYRKRQLLPFRGGFPPSDCAKAASPYHQIRSSISLPRQVFLLRPLCSGALPADHWREARRQAHVHRAPQR